MPIPEITVDELAERLAGEAVLFDVRQPDEYVSGHVPGAVLVPLNDVPDRLGEFPTAGEVLVVCRSGSRSMVASEFLVENGVAAVNVIGGTLAWIDSGRDVVVGEQPASAARWVDDAVGLSEVVAAAAAQPAYALDTEFHRERTYYPQLALVQLAWGSTEGDVQTAVIDPLAVDVAPLATLLDGPGLAVLHAAQQDLEVLARACATLPARLFDTQLAAGFLGYATPSLTNLVAAEMGLKLPKADRLSDWLRRPLSQDQLVYAASDVDHLLELHQMLTTQLVGVGRLAWAEAECEELRVRPNGPGEPEDAWMRLKDVRTLRGRARNVAKAVAAWRERRAASQDLPTRFILSDLALLGVAQRPPRNREQLRAVRGVEDRHLRSPLVDELLAAVAEGQADPTELHADDNGPDLDRRLRPAVTLVSAWVAQLARDQRLDTSLLATRSDLVELLSGNPTGRLSVGWRAEVLGDDVKRLVGGDAALAFDPSGQLRLLHLG